MRSNLKNIIITLFFIFPLASISQDAELKSLKKLVVTYRSLEKKIMKTGSVYTYKYDKDGKCLSSENRYNGDTASFNYYIYTPSGDLKKSIHYNKALGPNPNGTWGPMNDNKDITIFNYELDDKGNVIKSERINTHYKDHWKESEDTMFSYTKYIYDKNNRITSRISSMDKDHRGDPFEEYFIHGPFGLLEEKSYYNFKTDSVVKMMDYNKEGEITRLTELSTYSGRKSMKETIYYLDNNGNKKSKMTVTGYGADQVMFFSGRTCDSILYYTGKNVDRKFIGEKDPTDTIALLSFHGNYVCKETGINRRYKFDKEGRLIMYYSEIDGDGYGVTFEYKGKLITKRSTFKGIWTKTKPLDLTKPEEIEEYTYEFY